MKSLKGKNILVTSGGTQEYIDDVRILTNVSSGKLGAIVADQLSKSGANVYYVHGRGAVQPKISPKKAISARSSNDAMEAMKKVILENDIHAVVHAMAVSDFTFKRSKSLKCKSGDPQAFIQYMSETITTNSKIIHLIKDWKEDLILIGFKFEVGVSWRTLFSLAKKSIKLNRCDMVVVNDKKEMEKKKTHVARLVIPVPPSDLYRVVECVGKSEIATGIKHYLRTVL
jgi:phosphopantothenoylcysteine synthetase/decarboxylase